MSSLRQLLASLQAVPAFVKVMGIALGMAFVLWAGMLWQIHETWHRMALRDLERRGRAIANDVATRSEPLLQDGNTAGLQQLLEQIHDGISEIQYLVVLDAHSNVLARSESPADGPVREVAVPLAGGDVRVGLSEAHVAYEVGWLTRRLARTTAVIALLGMIAAGLLTRLFTRPIRELVAAARAVQAGDYRARAPVRANDEVGDLAAAFNEMTDALRQKEAARKKLLRQVIAAGEEERKHVARELHDQTGQALTSLIAGLNALEKSDPRAAELRQLAEQTLTEVHDLAVALRPSVLDDVGLVAALQKHCATFAQRHGIAVDCQAVGFDAARLPAEVETAAYRVAQEALTNAVRHSHARSVSVLLQRKNTGLLVVIEDDGEGFDATRWRDAAAENDRLGLLGIEERAALLGGTLRIESQPGKGTSLLVEIPCPKSAS
jgi:signal transduction histidine kinase